MRKFLRIRLLLAQCLFLRKRIQPNNRMKTAHKVPDIRCSLRPTASFFHKWTEWRISLNECRVYGGASCRGVCWRADARDSGDSVRRGDSGAFPSASSNTCSTFTLAAWLLGNHFVGCRTPQRDSESRWIWGLCCRNLERMLIVRCLKGLRDTMLRSHGSPGVEAWRSGIWIQRPLRLGHWQLVPWLTEAGTSPRVRTTTELPRHGGMQCFIRKAGTLRDLRGGILNMQRLFTLKNNQVV